MTTKSTRSITSRRMSARVMYRLSTVSYNRLFGYFLIVRGSLMTGPSLWVVAPSLVQGVCTYHITLAPRTQLGKATLLLSGMTCGPSAHLPHALEPVQIPMSASPIEHRLG